MATDINKILKNLYELYDLTDRKMITVGAGGGQLIDYGHKAKKVLAIDYDKEALNKLKDNLNVSERIIELSAGKLHVSLTGFLENGGIFYGIEGNSVLNNGLI